MWAAPWSVLLLHPTANCVLPPSSSITQGLSVWAQLFYPAPNEPWVKTTRYHEWFVMSLAAEQETYLVPWLFLPSPCLHVDQAMQGGHIKCTSKTGPRPRHLQRNKCVTAASVLICCYGLPSTEVSWWGQLKHLQYQLHLGVACLWSTLKAPPGTYPSSQGTRAGLLFQPLSSPQARRGAGRRWQSNDHLQGRAQHTWVLDMKNTPFQSYGSLHKAEHPKAQACSICQLNSPPACLSLTLILSLILSKRKRI